MPFQNEEFERLNKLLNSPDARDRELAAQQLGNAHANDKQTIDSLRKLALKDPDLNVQTAAREALSALGDIYGLSSGGGADPNRAEHERDYKSRKNISNATQVAIALGLLLFIVATWLAQQANSAYTTALYGLALISAILVLGANLVYFAIWRCPVCKNSWWRARWQTSALVEGRCSYCGTRFIYPKQTTVQLAEPPQVESFDLQAWVAARQQPPKSSWQLSSRAVLALIGVFLVVMGFEIFRPYQTPARSTATPVPTLPPPAGPPVAMGTIMLPGFAKAEPALWPSGSYTIDGANGTRELTNGKYHWETKVSVSSKQQVAIVPMPSVSDFSVSVKAQRVGGTKRADYGLVFRHTDPDNHYVFSVSDYLLHSFDVTRNGEEHTLLFPSTSSSINSGQVNELKVVAKGSHFMFYTNNHLVSQDDDTQLPTGSVGILVEAYDADTQAAFDFSDFQLQAP